MSFEKKKAQSLSLKEISLPPSWPIKPSTLTGFMFAPPHDGFYSTVISEHVKYHRAPANNLKHIFSSYWSPSILEQSMIDSVIYAYIDREEEKYRENFVQSVYIATEH